MTTVDRKEQFGSILQGKCGDCIYFYQSKELTEAGFTETEGVCSNTKFPSVLYTDKNNSPIQALEKAGALDQMYVMTIRFQTCLIPIK